jgi:hypothetical protein
VSDILAPEVLRRIDAFYDTTLKPKLEAIDDRRRQVRWLIIKSLLVVLPPIGVLIAGDLLDGILPFTSDVGTMVAAGLWLVAALVFVAMRYFLPGVTAYANYRSRFKQDIVADIFKVVCPLGAYDPLQGIAQDVFDAAGLFSTRGSFECDDRVRGRIGHTPFEGSEVGRAYSTGSGKNSRSYVVFRGLFFHLGFHRRLSGVTVIDPTQAHEYQLGERDGLSRLALGNPAFEKAFTVHASNEPESRALLTPAMMEQLLTVHRRVGRPVFVAFRDRRAFVGVHYGRMLFEPGVAQSTSKEAVREIAEHFALVETIVGELNRDAPATEADDTWFHGPDVEPHALSRLAAERAGTLTPSDVWAAASASIDDAAKDGGAPAPRPAGTSIRLERGPGELRITYGLRVGFWVILAISLGGALLAASALRAPTAPEALGAASAWVRTLPPIPWLDAFAADAPIPWLIVGTVVAVLFALGWTGAVRRVVIDGDRIRIHRGLRPVPRVYSRTQYGRVIRIGTRLYIAKRGNVRMMNPTASPGLTEPEAMWLTSEMKRALGQA